MTEETKLETSATETEEGLDSATDEPKGDEATETNEETGEVQDGEGEKGDKQEAAAADDPKDIKIRDLENKVREMDGRVGTERGQRNLLQRVVKSLDAKGQLNRDEIAEELGMERSRVDGILDATPSDDMEAFMKKAQAADKQMKAVSGVLKANGQDAEAISNTYGQLLQFDAQERERFMALNEDEVVEHIITRAKEAEAQLKPLVEAKGDPIAALANSQRRIAELEAENKALKGGDGEAPTKHNGQPKTRIALGGGSGGGMKTAGAEFTSKILG